MINAESLYYVFKQETQPFCDSIQSLTTLINGVSAQPTTLDVLTNQIAVANLAITLQHALTNMSLTGSQLNATTEQIHLLQCRNLFYASFVLQQAEMIEFWHLPFLVQNANLLVYLRTDFQIDHPQIAVAFYRLAAYDCKDRLKSLEYFESCLAISKLPLQEQMDACRASYNKVLAKSEWYYICGSFSSQRNLISFELRTIGRLRCTEAALAIERYRLKHSALPESLELLVPEFMAEVPRDPFDDQPLRYIRHDVGYTVYTIGEDSVDNGGLSYKEMLKLNNDERPEHYDWPFRVRR